MSFKVDPLAQLVEHNTFNVGVLGSSPKRITKKNPQETEYQSLADFLLFQMHHFCTTERPINTYYHIEFLSSSVILLSVN